MSGLPRVDGGPAPAMVERLSYLHEVGRLLWPPPAVFGIRRARAMAAGPGMTAVSTFLLLPRADRPRLLVPASRRAAAAAVRGYGEPGSRAVAAGARVLPLLLSGGFGSVALRSRFQVSAPPGTATVESWLREAYGPDTTFSMHLGAPRANRKPVLQLISSRGHPIGFAKVGINALTSELVRAERAALTQLGQSRLTQLQLPTVLRSGSWEKLDILVLSPLPTGDRRTDLPTGRLGAAMAELAAARGLRSGPLSGSAYLRQVNARLAATDPGPQRESLATALRALEQRAGHVEFSFGCWHGDWTPWNMASTRSGLLVWDWERFTEGAPVGFDALHCQLQGDVVTRRGQLDAPDAIAACARLASAAPQLLAPFRPGTASTELTVILYLVDIAIRYLADHQEGAGQKLGSPGTWLIPAIRAAITRL